MTGSRRHVFLSPHPDDAVFSCGGTIRRLALAGERPLVVTVFGGDRPPGAPLSAFAQGLHRRWQCAGDPPAARRAEDRAACEELGARVLHLAFPDAIYRARSGAPLYPSSDAIFGELADPELVDAVASGLGQLLEAQGVPGGPVLLRVPVAAGNHVDHRITRQAAQQIARDIEYFEDYPYARAESAAGEQDRLVRRLEPLDPGDLDARVQASLRYRSQIGMLFGAATAAESGLRSFAHAVGGGRPAERFWIPALPR